MGLVTRLLATTHPVAVPTSPQDSPLELSLRSSHVFRVEEKYRHYE